MTFISGMWFHTFSTTVFKTVVKNVLNTYFTTVFKTVVKNVLDRQTTCFTVANFRDDYNEDDVFTKLQRNSPHLRGTGGSRRRQ